MSSITAGNAQQYGDSRKLAARARLNRDYTIADGYDAAERLMWLRFGNVTMSQPPARLRVTEPEDVYLALTSYPPGDEASDAGLAQLRTSIAEAFQAGNGVLEVEKESGLFISRKTA